VNGLSSDRRERIYLAQTHRRIELSHRQYRRLVKKDNRAAERDELVSMQCGFNAEQARATP
jgi:hypothetical protein